MQGVYHIRELEKAAELTKDPQEKVELLCMADEIRNYKNNRMGINTFKHILDIASHYVPAHFSFGRMLCGYKPAQAIAEGI